MLNNIPGRVVSRAVWHQTRPSNELLHFEHPATYDGRYNRAGEPGVWYASFTERGAWAELCSGTGASMRSHPSRSDAASAAPVEDLAILDLTNERIRAQLYVSEEQLVADDWTRCQSIAEDARRAVYDGILAPSGPLSGETTLVVFASAMHKVVAEHSRVQRPPIRMVDVLTRIRVPMASSTESVRCTTPSPRSGAGCADGEPSGCHYDG